eukprot:gnl/Chilomastix_caulleri/6508.p1 GENE.gnl/Chilomastix_caulleri/6508~~gnl/Chilomastix_caulleri/6508.p1  ORF type:complete len:117 (+),score=43.47 gnl/Chilomastix_caulleri/6508:153-503(+)
MQKMEEERRREEEKQEEHEVSVKELPVSTSTSTTSDITTQHNEQHSTSVEELVETTETTESTHRQSIELSAYNKNDEENFGVFPDDMPDIHMPTRRVEMSTDNSDTLSVMTDTGMI